MPLPLFIPLLINGAMLAGRITAARRAVTRSENQDYPEAGEFTDIGQHWIDTGADIESPELPRLIAILRQAVDEATPTKRDVTDRI
jgi:hypothetical protein